MSETRRLGRSFELLLEFARKQGIIKEEKEGEKEDGKKSR